MTDDDFNDDSDDRDLAAEREDDESGWKCALGERCLVADPYHHSSECFDLEWAEWYYNQPPDPDDAFECPSKPESRPMMTCPDH